MHLDVLDADVAEAAQLTGINRPLTGTLAFSINVSGTRDSPYGEGHCEIREGSAYGVSIPTFKGDLRLANDEIELSHFEARAYNASLSGRASMNTTTHQVQLSADGRNIDLARFPRLPSGRFILDGIADFTAQLTGTPQEPTVDMHVRVKDLALDKERTGDFYLDAVTHGRSLDLKGHSDFDQASLNIQGSVDLEKDFAADLNLDFQNLNIVSLLSIYLPGKITGHTPAGGTVHVRGPLRTPRDLLASVEIRSFSAQVEHVQAWRRR